MYLRGVFYADHVLALTAGKTHGGNRSSRVFAEAELERLGAEALGFLQFLESAGVLTPVLREVVLDRVLAVPRGPVALDDFKILVLLVFWSRGEEPDALILDELFVDDEDRLIH